MIRIPRRPLATTVAAALAVALLAPVVVHAAAQDRQLTPREKREQQKRAREEAGQKPAKYPDATRESPEATASGKTIKQLQALQELYEKEDMAGVIAKVEEIVAMPAAGAYEKSYAYSMAGNASAELDDQARAADYFAKAVEANGLDNDSHYNTMYNLAVIQYGEGKYAEALATVERFLAETRSDKPQYQDLHAGILMNLDRHDEAAAIYQELVAKNPDDKRILMNAVAALQNAEKADQANVLLESAYKRGMLTESRELRALYVGYMNADRWDDAQNVIEDGLTKGILQPGPDLARDYQVLAQNAYAEDKIALATEFYRKAAPMATDGEAYLNLAKILEYDGKKTEAKAAAQQALDKGVKKPEDAKRILGR